MTRETAKKNIEIIKAYAEGKDIQILEVDETTWSDIGEPFFSENRCYRIKPESKYVPWTKENCLLKCGDMVIFKDGSLLKKTTINAIDMSEESCNEIHLSFDYMSRTYEEGCWMSLDFLFEHYVMKDGTPCGMKVEA